ncbi:MAG TPA: hypothetical protein VMG99_07900 [Thermoplasmata archaeon]|nr:hypothetical protein [Thermoplasmata archaeon]
MPTTTIQIDLEVRDRLRAIGRMGESYNDVIRRLLETSRRLGAPPPEARPSSPAIPRVWIPFREKR